MKEFGVLDIVYVAYAIGSAYVRAGGAKEVPASSAPNDILRKKQQPTLLIDYFSHLIASNMSR